jgi:hypothetical protein
MLAGKYLAHTMTLGTPYVAAEDPPNEDDDDDDDEEEEGSP